MCHQYQLLLLHDFESSCSIFFTTSLQNPFNPQHNMAKKISVPRKTKSVAFMDDLCSFCCYIMSLLQNLGGDGWMGTLNIHFTNPGIKFM
jgi:hypothetical protein